MSGKSTQIMEPTAGPVVRPGLVVEPGSWPGRADGRAGLVAGHATGASLRPDHKTSIRLDPAAICLNPARAPVDLSAGPETRSSLGAAPGVRSRRSGEHCPSGLGFMG